MNWNVLPGPALRWQLIMPPCASIIDLQMARPIPNPPGFDVKKASKMRSRNFGSNPVPPSCTATATLPASSAERTTDSAGASSLGAKEFKNASCTVAAGGVYQGAKAGVVSGTWTNFAVAAPLAFSVGGVAHIADLLRNKKPSYKEIVAGFVADMKTDIEIINRQLNDKIAESVEVYNDEPSEPVNI